MRLPPRGEHLQLSVPTVRPAAARPYERKGGELRVGPHQVVKRPFWGCSTVPYVYDLIVGGMQVKRFLSPPTEQECTEAIRARAATQQPPAVMASPKRKRGRPPTQKP